MPGRFRERVRDAGEIPFAACKREITHSARTLSGAILNGKNSVSNQLQSNTKKRIQAFSIFHGVHRRGVFLMHVFAGKRSGFHRKFMALLEPRQKPASMSETLVVVD
jgi:hypothetical protein